MTSVAFMSSKQYRIVFGYLLYSHLQIIAAIVDAIAKFYVIQEKWALPNPLMHLAENNEYCEWSEYNDNVIEHKSTFGNVLFDVNKSSEECLKLRWEFEYAMRHSSDQALFIGISNDMSHSWASPLVYANNDKIFAGYGICFYKRQNDNPFCLELDCYSKDTLNTGGIFQCLSTWIENDGIEINDFVFGKIIFEVNVFYRKCYISKSIYIYPHPGISNKLHSKSNRIPLETNCEDAFSSYFLACYLPFGASLKLNCFSSSGDFHYRNEM